jgi:hypothetical protein
LSRLKLVRPEKARITEDALIKGAQNGRIKQKITEEQLIATLEQFGPDDQAAPGGGGKKGVVIQRRKYGIDDDDNDDDSDLL